MPGAAPPRSALVSVLVVVVITGFVVLVATLAASTGPADVFDGSGPNPDRISTTPPSDTPNPVPEVGNDSDIDRLLDERGGSLTRLGAIVRGVLLALIVVAIVLLAFFTLRRRRPGRPRSPAEEVDPDFAVVDALAAVSSALIGDAEDQDIALSQGSPRNGIVEAWLRFEVMAARVGVPREEWETSTEFTLRLLTSVRGDPEATSRLADLYRLARFSDHPVGETERAAAAAALGRIRESLGAAAESAR